jgi:hypothetical protein
MTREILTHQALFSGQITDALTGGAPRTPPLVTVVRDADDRPVGDVVVRPLPGGQYVVHGVPSALPPAVDIVLRVEVAAQGYAPAQRPVAFVAADLTRVVREITIDGETSRTLVVAAPARREDVALAPLPVTLVGRVGRAEDPAVPIPGAEVRITAPAARGPVVTDADGFFTLGPAPVATTITLSITALGREPLTPEMRLDHGSPVNQAAFALEPS